MSRLERKLEKMNRNDRLEYLRRKMDRTDLVVMWFAGTLPVVMVLFLAFLALGAVLV